MCLTFSYCSSVFGKVKGIGEDHSERKVSRKNVMLNNLLFSQKNQNLKISNFSFRNSVICLKGPLLLGQKLHGQKYYR